MFKSGSAIIMALWKMHLEARTLVIFRMDVNLSLMMTRKLMLRVTPNMRDVKDLQITLR